MQTEARSN